MQKHLILLIFLFPASINAQLYINKSKSSIKNEVANYQKKNPSYRIDISETDSSFLIVEKNQTEHLLQFDNANTCKLESILLKCDTCYKTVLSQILEIKKYNWRKINGNQYISNFESKLMVELLLEENLTTIKIIRTDWSKLLYDMLKEN